MLSPIKRRIWGKHFPYSEGVALWIVTRISRDTGDGNSSEKRKSEEKTFYNRKS